MILLIDNYDSFTFNLVHLIRKGGHEVTVHRNDTLTVSQALELQATGLVISPGPGGPPESGICPELVERLVEEIPILGVCLGLQIIAEIFGARIVRAPRLVHGKTSLVRHNEVGLFRGLPNPLQAMRYHSLIVDRESLPERLEVTAWVEDDEETIMGLRHRQLPVEGIQFHPESFMTPHGSTLINAFMENIGVAQ